MSTTETPVYDTAESPSPVIEELTELLRYRDLVVQLIARNIKTRYKRSILGLVWSLLNPLMMMVVLTLVFAQIFRFSTEHYAVYALSGLVFWNFFAQSTSYAMNELIWGGSLLSRIYVPKTIFAVSALGTGLINLLMAIIPLLFIAVATGVPIRVSFLWLPVPILFGAMFALGVGLILSTLVAYFADIVDVFQILVTAWMYLTPVIYPKEIIPERYIWLLELNPMYHLLQVFRTPIYDGVLPEARSIAIAGTLALTTLLLGWYVFTSNARELPYRV